MGRNSCVMRPFDLLKYTAGAMALPISDTIRLRFVDSGVSKEGNWALKGVSILDGTVDRGGIQL